MLSSQVGTLQEIPCEEQSVSLPELFGAITSLGRRLQQFESRTLRESGLTPRQFFVIGLLSAKNDRPLAELADASSCTRATMTGIVDTLERNALVQRVPHPVDRRSTLVRLTEQGAARAAAAQLGGVFGSCCCELLTADESRDLARLLARLAEELPF